MASFWMWVHRMQKKKERAQFYSAYTQHSIKLSDCFICTVYAVVKPFRIVCTQYRASAIEQDRVIL